MRKKTFQISIPEPCDQQWEDMTPQAKGRFCDQCTKTIVDFSQKTDREIALELKASGGQLCGRFSNDQLNRDIILATALKNNSQWKATGLLLSSMLMMSACKEEGRVVGKIVPVEQFETWEEEKVDELTTLGEIAPEVDLVEDMPQGLSKSFELTEPPMALGVVTTDYSHIANDKFRSTKITDKSKFVILLGLIFGGILLFIFVLEMITRAAV